MYFENGTLDALVLGKVIYEATVEVLQRAPVEIAESNLKCYHVQYDEFVKNPVDVIKDLYRFHGWTYTEEYDTTLRSFIEKEQKIRSETAKKDRVIAHSYNLADFGLNMEDILKLKK
jgi:hypothetical protein